MGAHFVEFALAAHGPDWDDLDAIKYRDEPAAISALLTRAPLSAQQSQNVVEEAATLVAAARASARKQGVLQSFLKEFSLASQEGLALMCLAEALLRTPDAETRDQLIAQSISSGDWASHIGHSDSLFVNASTWGLMLTGQLVDTRELKVRDLSGWLAQLAGRIGEPVIRQAVATAIRIMSNQFVLGRTIQSALERASREGFICSFDMLGEGARTADDAERYERLYADAIDAVGTASANAGPEWGHGISIKLSALSPRFEATQEARIQVEIYPRLLKLARQAAGYNLNLTIDAEESDRLIPSLQLFSQLAQVPELNGWTGLGLAVQAYQKRGLAVIEGVAKLALDTHRRFMVRLVKGAYWDSEIKQAQVAGRPDYPVFTRKSATDLSYLVCAKALIDAAPALYPQFATHNAHTLAAVTAMANQSGVTIEHQRLHGMGEELYRAAEDRYGKQRLRVYAPVGGHTELLPYLARRLLENGANTSFVQTLLDKDVPIQEVVADPIALTKAHPDRHPRLPPPPELYGPSRRNALGRDFSMATDRAVMRRQNWNETFVAGPIIGGRLLQDGEALSVINPANKAQIGVSHTASAAHLEKAVALAKSAQPQWDAIGGTERAKALRAMGDALEREMDALVSLLVREGGKTLADSVAEVREASDFCRYYAMLAEQQFARPLPLKGPVGETNRLELHGRGVFACISPWNFPLAIFTGQIAAALAAGNAVIAKPAEQTPLIAAKAIQLFYSAGLNPDLLALLPGNGSAIGALLTAHPGIDGISFTGGTDTALAINRTLAARDGPIIPLIAETGGLNAMFVDSSALREQVIDDVLLSAFGSAGQRCSALRMLIVPENVADALIEGLIGALEVRNMGDPSNPATDIGPVIDDEARANLDRHVERLRHGATLLYVKDIDSLRTQGSYFAPIIAEIPSPAFLQQEVFGPILHICRYQPDNLEKIAGELAASGYALTLGIHSRVEAFAEKIRGLVPAGNTYVNRSIIGAVVGVQPFGGEGLSGTGPKAGGPHTLLRYATERALTVNIAARGGDPSVMNL